MSSNTDTLFRRIVSLGEDGLTDLSNRLLENKAFARALEQALERGFKTKKNVDRNMQIALGLLNMPSKRDYKNLSDKIESLNGKIVSLSLKVDKVVAAVEPEKKRTPPKRKPPTKKTTAAASSAAAADEGGA